MRSHPHPSLEVTSAEPFRKTAAAVLVWFEGDAAALAWVAMQASLRKPFVKGRTARSHDGGITVTIRNTQCLRNEEGF